MELPKETIERKENIFDFLLGQGSLDGYWYGDHPHGKGAFWWRKNLKEEQEKALRSLSEIEKLETEITAWEEKSLDDDETIEKLKEENRDLKIENQLMKDDSYEVGYQIGKSELESQNKELMEALRDFHNKIMVQWEKDFGSIHSEQQMDAYTVSGFMLNILKSLPNKEA